MAKELQIFKQGGKLVRAFTQAKLKKEILDELLSLDIVMQELYSKFCIMHKVIFHLNRWHQRCVIRALILVNMHAIVDYMQTCR